MGHISKGCKSHFKSGLSRVQPRVEKLNIWNKFKHESIMVELGVIKTPKKDKP